MDRRIVITNFLWRFMERCVAQGVSLLVSIVLARLLDPSVYGTIALITVITAVLQVFIDSGLGNALVQKQNADNKDFSTVFFFNVFVCMILYIGMFFAAPFISSFYNVCELTPVIRVLSLTLVISGVKNIQEAYVSCNMLYKKFFFATIGGTLAAALMGIYMAYKGFGVWALVAQNLCNMTIDTMILWVTVKWRPECFFSFKRLKSLFSFGSKLLASRFIAAVYFNIRQLLIGKIYSSSDLAYYNRGYDLPAKIVPNVVTAINSVLLPTLSKEQDDKKRVLGMVRRAARVSSYIIWPTMIGMATCAESIVRLLLTEKWMGCVPYLWIFCIDYAFWPLIYIYNTAINALGKSDIYLRIQIVQKIIGIITLVISLRINVIAIAVLVPVISLLELFMILSSLQKLLNYRYTDQLKDIVPPIIVSIIMGGVIMLLNLMNLSDFLQIILNVFAGITIYMTISWIFKLDSFVYLFNMFFGFFKRREKTE